MPYEKRPTVAAAKVRSAQGWRTSAAYVYGPQTRKGSRGGQAGEPFGEAVPVVVGEKTVTGRCAVSAPGQGVTPVGG